MTGETVGNVGQFIQLAIENEIKRVSEEELENAKKRIDERKSQIIAGVVLHVQKQMEVNTLEGRIVISVRTS